VISVVSNICPRRVADIFAAYRRGDASVALGIQHELLPLIKALFTETNPAPVKYALELMGKCSGELRLPLSEVRESTKEIIQQEFEKIK
jgi:4-hydroxy-tetrahydrodipicolinate synthase